MAKIAFIGNTSWSMYNFRLELLNELKSKHQIVVIAPKDEYSQKIVDANIEFIDLPIRGQAANPFGELKTAYQLYSILKQIKPDLTFSYTIKPNLYSSFASRFLGLKNIAITTGLGYVFTNKNLISIVAKQLYKIAFKYPQEIWFLNEDDLSTFSTEQLVDSSKVKVLPGEGINLSKFQNEGKQFSKPDSFLFLGRLIWEKGFGEFAEAAKQIKSKYPDVQFNVVGFLNVENPKAVPQETVDELVASGIINYWGPTDNVIPYLEQTSALIFPSYYSEGLPRVIMEASAMETPVIVADNVGSRDAVQNNVTGYLVKPKNVGDLTKKIEQFLQLSDEEKKKMGKSGREYMENNFSQEKINSYYVEAIQRMLGIS